MINKGVCKVNIIKMLNAIQDYYFLPSWRDLLFSLITPPGEEEEYVDAFMRAFASAARVLRRRVVRTPPVVLDVVERAA